MTTRLIERGFCSKARYFHGSNLLSDLASTIIIRGQLGDKEWELFSDIHTYKVLLGHIGCAIGIGEDDIDNVSGTTETRGTLLYCCQGEISPKSIGDMCIESRVANRQVVESTMLIYRSCIIGQLHGSVEQFPCCCLKLPFLLCWHIVRSRKRHNERITVKGVDLVKYDSRNHESCTPFWGSGGSKHADDDINIYRAGGGTESFYQKIDISRISRPENISIQTFNRQHPAELTHQITILRLREDRLDRLSICQSRRLGSSG